jgi:hypothetical protein
VVKKAINVLIFKPDYLHLLKPSASPMLFCVKFSRLVKQACKFCICLAIVALNLDAVAQDTGAVKKLIRIAENQRARFPAEKLYLQFDRPNYTTYDTIWFKASLFNAATYSPSRLSSKVYIELISDSSIVVNRFAIPMVSGLGQGHIVLDEKIKDGTYTVRAYTNWMQNFGDEAYFSKQFYVGKPSDQGSWLISEQHILKTQPQGNEVSIALKLSNLNNAIIPYRDLELRLTEGEKTLFKNNYLTSDGGSITANFILPKKADMRQLSLLITDKTNKNKYSFPFYPGGQLQDVDLQFMPEGGNLVNGLSSRVAFKAIGEDGLGTAVNGKILSNTGREVCNFATEHNGMGSFFMIPRANETYTAKYELNGVTHSVPLPVAKPSGLALRVDNLSSPDSIYVYIRATPEIAAANKPYSLIIQSVGEIYLGLSFKISRGFTNIHLAKNQLMSGIVGFTIIDADNKPLCERRIFIDHHDRLNLEIADPQLRYQPKDSIALNINVCHVNGAPVIGSFAVAITDDAFIKADPLADNIVSRLLLISELKGYIETPGWYFTPGTANTITALDNLMLAQGWTGFDWDKALQTPPPQPKFKPEPDNRLTGTLRNLFNKPAKDSKLNLFSISKKYGLLVFDTVSNAKGEFVFDNLPLLDTISYTLRVNNKKDKASTADIVLDIFKPAGVTGNGVRLMPWFMHVNDTAMLAYFNRPQPPRYNGIDISEVKGRLLKEVKIKAGKPNISAGQYSGYVQKEFSEKELVEAGKTTLYDLISRKVGGFGTGHLYSESIFGKATYHEQPALVVGMTMVSDIIVDGQGTSIMSADGKGSDPQTAIDFMKSIGADDVKNIKVAEGMNMFITVTTRSGHGIFTRPAFNILSYRPVPLCLPRQFYRPKYDVKNAAALTPRPTIHWEPNLITDKNGKASLSFYAADKPGTYTIIIEGTDMNGNFGRQTGKILIAPPVRATTQSAVK